MKSGYMSEHHMPWMDTHLTEGAMKHLWEIIDIPMPIIEEEKKSLAGNISKSIYIQDKDNWFYENVLKEMTEHLYYSDWKNYYEVIIRQRNPASVFSLKSIWVNYQKQHEFNPPHRHGSLYSFVVFMKIPTHWKEQHALPFSADSNSPVASNFQFLMGQGQGGTQTIQIPLSPEDEGRILFFPAWLQHQVFPFYGTEEERITISGNIILQEDWIEEKVMEESVNEKEKAIEEMEKQIVFIRASIKEDTEKNDDRGFFKKADERDGYGSSERRKK